MSLNISGYNISDIYTGDDKIDKIFVGEDLVYSSVPAIECFYFEVERGETANVGFTEMKLAGDSDNKTRKVWDDSYDSYLISQSNYARPTFYYSFDKNNWDLYTFGNSISIGGNNPSRVYFKGNNLQQWEAYWNNQGYDGGIWGLSARLQAFINGGLVGAYGDIRSLRYGDDPSNYSLTVPCNAAYKRLFMDCVNLTHAPTLAATTLTEACYAGMFYGCTNLTEAPELPAMTMEKNCYSAMFTDCTSLEASPELPAITLAQQCYGGLSDSMFEYDDQTYHTMSKGMFYGCTSLIEAPELPAMTMEEGCYANMFNGCTSLVYAPELPATTLAASCYYYMFGLCTSLTTVPELPATVLASSCYGAMFISCTSLTTVPILPALDVPSMAYDSMFMLSNVRANNTASGVCVYPYRIPSSGTGTVTSKALNNMFQNLDGTETYYTPSANTDFYISVPSI